MTRPMTTVQEKELDKLEADMEALKKQAGKAIQYAYISNGIGIMLYSAEVIYLTRPKVKEVFPEEI